MTDKWIAGAGGGGGKGGGGGGGSADVARLTVLILVR